MLIGFMHRPKKPRFIAKVTAIMSAHYGLEIIYLTPNDVDMENNIVTGKMYIKNKWIPVTKPLPKLIDASSTSFNNATTDIMTYLRKNTVLTFDKKGTPNKDRLQKELYEDINFTHLVIPTKKLDSFHILEKFLIKYPSIVLKPLSGQQGVGIYGLRKQSDSYILSYGREEKILNSKEFFEFYKKHLVDEEYIAQKMIESKTRNGDPFDCRIIVQKDGSGKWVPGKFLIRIGTGQKVVSNASQGGCISEAKSFLKVNFKEQWEDIYKNLKKIAVTLPYKIEEIKKTATMDLGLDIGIEEDGGLFLFEANNGASLDCLISESAIFRLEYYQYLIDTHPVLKKANTKNQTSTEDTNFYKNKYDQMKKSRSWRLTRPIRMASSFIKKIRKKKVE